jgi:hypothetical protein
MSRITSGLDVCGTFRSDVINPFNSSKILLSGLAWPNTDGSSGQVLTTNGSGDLYFTTSSGTAATVTLQTAYNNTNGTVEIILNNTHGAFTINEGTVTIGNNLFEVLSTSSTNAFFAVGDNFVTAQNFYSTNASISNLIVSNATLLNVNLSSVTINDLSVTNFTTTNLTATNIYSTNIVSTNATITNAYIYNLSGGTASFNNLYSSNASIVNLVATTATFTNEYVTNLSGGTASFNNLYTTNASIVNLVSTNATITNSFVSNLSVTNATIVNEYVTNLSGGTASFNNLYSTNASIVNLSATTATMTNEYVYNLSGGTASFDYLYSNNFSIVNLSATNATIVNEYVTNLSGGTASFSNLYSTNASILNLVVTTATITNEFVSVLSGATASFSNLYSTNASIVNLSATTATITNEFVSVLSGATASFSNLYSTNASIVNLIATTATITNEFVSVLSGATASFNNLYSTNASIVNLLATTATITNLFSSNAIITGGTISGINLTNVTLSSNTIRVNYILPNNSSVININSSNILVQMESVSYLGSVSESGATTGDFGYSVSANDKNILVVGLPTSLEDKGSARVYDRNYNLLQILSASDGIVGDEFGNSVSINNNDIIAVGNYDYVGYGAVYIFGRTTSSWSQLQKISGSSIGGGSLAQLFGSNVSISDDNYIIVGIQNYGDPGNLGYAALYNQTGSSWSFINFTPVTGLTDGDQYGYSTAINNSYIVIGSPGKNSNVGSVYIYDKTPTLLQSFDASDVSAEFFGNWVSINNKNNIVIGAPYFTGSGNNGMAFIYGKTTSSWTRLQQLNPIGTLEHYGRSVSINNNDDVVIGSGTFITDEGSIFIYKKDLGTTSSSWSLVTSITAPSSPPNGYGGATQINNNNFIYVGDHRFSSYTGIVYIYEDMSTLIQPNDVKTLYGYSMETFTNFITSKDNVKLTINGLAWPSTDGSANYVLKTDGYGNLSFASAASLTSLQNAYDNSTNPEIVVNNTNGGLTIRDNSTPINANLFEVQNNSGTTSYFTVGNNYVNMTNATAGLLRVNNSLYVSTINPLTTNGLITVTSSMSMPSLHVTSSQTLYANTMQANTGTLVTMNSSLIISSTKRLTSTNLFSTTSTLTNLMSTTGTILNLFGQNVSITNSTITNLVSTTATITGGNVINLLSTTATITSGNVSNLVSTTATITGGNVSNLVSTTATITGGNVSNLVSTTATITSGNVSNLVSTTATITGGNVINLVSTTATITNLNITNISSTTATITNILGININGTTSTLTNINSTSLFATTATITSLFASSASFINLSTGSIKGNSSSNIIINGNNTYNTAFSFPIQELTSFFSVSVSANKDYIINGGGASDIYIYNYETLNLVRTLTCSGTANAFVTDIATNNNNTIALGLTSFSVVGDGALAIFSYTNSTWTSFQNQYISKLSSRFGDCVSLNDSDFIAVGCRGDSTTGGTNCGSAFIYGKSGSSWVELQNIFAPDFLANSRFGDSISINNSNIIVVCASRMTVGGTSNSGKAYIYGRTTSSWSLLQSITPSDGPTSGLQYGISCCINNKNEIVVGADYGAGGTGAGKVYYYGKSGSSWAQLQIITPSGSNGDLIGSSVSINDNKLLGIGSPGRNSNKGGGYTYYMSNTSSSWSLLKNIDLSYLTSSSSERAGYSCSLGKNSRTTLLFGSHYLGSRVTGYVCEAYNTNASILNQNSIHTPNVYSSSVNADSINSTSSNITNLTTTAGNITSLTATSANVTSLSATSLNVTSGTITTLSSVTGTITNLTSTTATITTGTITTINSTTGNISTLTTSTLSNGANILTVLSALLFNSGLYISVDSIYTNTVFGGTTDLILTTSSNNKKIIIPAGRRFEIQALSSSGNGGSVPGMQKIWIDTNTYYGINCQDALSPGTGSWGNMVFVSYGNTSFGSISSSYSGSSTAYGTSSDYRLKINVEPMNNALNRLMSLKPINFNWVSEPSTEEELIEAFNMRETSIIKENGYGQKSDGFLAHEIQDIVPYAVTGEKDEMNDDGTPRYQNVDHSKLVPLLTGAIQELTLLVRNLQTTITTLQERITVLENK